MQMVDIDAAIEAVQDVVELPVHEFSVLCDKLEALAVDAEPVVHSHWEVAIGYDPSNKVQCQNCFLMAHEPTSRCPHCGAKMDQEE